MTSPVQLCSAIKLASAGRNLAGCADQQKQQTQNKDSNNTTTTTNHNKTTTNKQHSPIPGPIPSPKRKRAVNNEYSVMKSNHNLAGQMNATNMQMRSAMKPRHHNESNSNSNSIPSTIQKVSFEPHNNNFNSSNNSSRDEQQSYQTLNTVSTTLFHSPFVPTPHRTLFRKRDTTNSKSKSKSNSNKNTNTKLQPKGSESPGGATPFHFNSFPASLPRVNIKRVDSHDYAFPSTSHATSDCDTDPQLQLQQQQPFKRPLVPRPNKRSSNTDSNCWSPPSFLNTSSHSHSADDISSTMMNRMQSSSMESPDYHHHRRMTTTHTAMNPPSNSIARTHSHSKSRSTPLYADDQVQGLQLQFDGSNNHNLNEDECSVKGVKLNFNSLFSPDCEDGDGDCNGNGGGSGIRNAKKLTPIQRCPLRSDDNTSPTMNDNDNDNDSNSTTLILSPYCCTTTTLLDDTHSSDCTTGTTTANTLTSSASASALGNLFRNSGVGHPQCSPILPHISSPGTSTATGASFVVMDDVHTSSCVAPAGNHHNLNNNNTTVMSSSSSSLSIANPNGSHPPQHQHQHQHNHSAVNVSTASTSTSTKKIRPMPDISAFDDDNGLRNYNTNGSNNTSNNNNNTLLHSPCITSTPNRSTMACPPTPVKTPEWVSSSNRSIQHYPVSSSHHRRTSIAALDDHAHDTALLMAPRLVGLTESKILVEGCYCTSFSASFGNESTDDTVICADDSATMNSIGGSSSNLAAAVDHVVKMNVSNATCSTSSTVIEHSDASHDQQHETAVEDAGAVGPPMTVLTFNTHFENLGQLGSGTFADVYKCRDVQTRQIYAIKRSRRPFRSLRDRDAALEEVRTMQKLQTSPSPCVYIVQFVRAWQEDGYFYSQMEVCSKCDCAVLLDALKQHQHQHRTHQQDYSALLKLPSSRLTPLSTIYKIAHDVCRGLQHIHDHGMVHHDIKPSNIFFSIAAVDHAAFSGGGNVMNPICKIGDYGTAGSIGSSEDGHEADTAYMPLESLQSNGVLSTAGDMFSFGMTLYELSSGVSWSVPNEGRRWHEVRAAGHVCDLPQCRPASLGVLIGSLITPDFAQRPSASDVLQGSVEVRSANDSVDEFLRDYLLDVEEYELRREREIAERNLASLQRRFTPTGSVLRGEKGF
eukprot:CAMPEP_0116049760 /NCGR_PEP_ID=MMETSP0321-20121206/30339_1 /TAXON_ID=163516 /ORGANISM="Leptocylindrus danicus var. danicus, Strain B650" /LENGTH=1146 /DNA_ID=CAMNT_0003532213 /DNA_START=82 /DNA_END=3522 /DNA_ORIENTATION=-